MTYTCPVCDYDQLRHPPEDHIICPSCGTQFGYSDAGAEPPEFYWKSLRIRWIDRGRKWHSKVVLDPKK